MVDPADDDLAASILSSEAVRTDFDSYLPLVRVGPHLVREEMIDAAFARIEEASSEVVRPDSAPLAIAVAGIAAGRDQDRLDRLIALLHGAMPGVLERDPEEMGSVVDAVVPAIEGAQATPTMPELAEWLVANRGAVPVASRLPTLKLALLLCRLNPDAGTRVGAAIADWIFELDGQEIFEVLASQLGDPPGQLRDRAAILTTEAVSGAREYIDRAISLSLLELFPEAEATTIARNAVQMAIEGGRTEAAGAVFERLDPPERRQILDESRERARSAPVQNANDLGFVFSQSPQVSESELFELATEVATRIHDDRGVVGQLAPILAAVRLSEAGLRLELVERLLRTEADMSDVDNRSLVLRAAWKVAGRPASRAKEAVTQRLQEIREDPGDALSDLGRELAG